MKKACLTVGVLIGAFAHPAVAGPPDAALNPVTSLVEIVDAVEINGVSEVRHTVDQSPSPLVTILSDASADDTTPRIATSNQGDAFVVWMRESDGSVRSRQFSYSLSAWGASRVISDSGDTARNPEVVHDGTDAWCIYEAQRFVGADIVVGIIVDEPNPVLRSVVHSTPYSGDIDALIHYDMGKLWLTWVDDATHVGWSEFNYSTSQWTVVSSEDFSADSPEAARSRIRSKVTGV